ncbi:GNAT family N-acetyltransferase [Paenibacillus humicola]|uniref:GNAT family N-acetyltransferase n=1 Tax=Paenibacillus humicola TaxID=3110540 RepID=UPI00237C1D1F|nr:GNAT family N-acetyltransferase [Paenibacillus humicola]
MPQTFYRVEPLLTETDARAITDFFLSGDSFDDMNHTPGELSDFRLNPMRALSGRYVYRMVKNEAGDMIGVISFMENEQRTGGYYWDYIVVHKAYRGRGVGSLLIGEMLAELRSLGARYVVTYTCDLPVYAAIRALFERSGFSAVGRCPDYYFDGEDRLIYYLKL